MRFGGKTDLLHLVVLLSGTHEGMTLEEIRLALGVSYRTAQRMLAALREKFAYTVEEAEPDGTAKRWRMRASELRGLVAPNAAELMELDTAARLLRQEGGAEGRAETLERLGAKVRAAMRGTDLNRAAPDMEALMQAEGTAFRPGPRHRVPEALLLALRQAILASARVKLCYGGDPAQPREHVVEPLGILHGRRPYLVAQIKDLGPDPTVFRMDRVLDHEVLDESFRRDTPFDLAAYAAGSFGMWREKPVAVCLRFSTAAARDAACFQFHPRQEVEKGEDGTLLVRFTAGGQREMCFHLLTWGDTVEVLHPPELRELLANWAGVAATHHAHAPDGAA